MKKIIMLVVLSAFFVSCATEKVIPVGRINKITSAKEAVVNYPEVNLKAGDKVNLIRVYWAFSKRYESLVLSGVVTNVLGNDLYEIKFEGDKEISESNIVRKI